MQYSYSILAGPGTRWLQSVCQVTYCIPTCRVYCPITTIVAYSATLVAELIILLILLKELVIDPRPLPENWDFVFIFHSGFIVCLFQNLIVALRLRAEKVST